MKVVITKKAFLVLEISIDITITPSNLFFCRYFFSFTVSSI
ncbi:MULTISPECIES: hypothetical protein [Candidatus Ichthyocystis]|nr:MULTISPECIES: hypothetical protein [Ichthyocystis]